MDEFIIFDDMQFTKRDWRNRNKIKTQNGVQWLTIPVEVKGKYFQKINETKIGDPSWGKRHWKTISHNYSKARSFDQFRDAFEELYLKNDKELLSEINQNFIILVCSILGIHTKLRWSSEFRLFEGKTERLVDLCKSVGATDYYSGPAAKNYLNESLFEREGIKVHYFDYSGYPVYHQLYGDFVHEVSIIDLIFNEGNDARKYMKSFGSQIMVFDKILKQVGEYYTEKIRTYGPSPRGVDWNSEESQQLRFVQVLKIIPSPLEHFSILDYGCGFGSMYEFMKRKYPDFRYTGYDISTVMIEQAKKLHSNASVEWKSSVSEIQRHDYVIASGIFNVRLGNSNEEWEKYIVDTLHLMDQYSAKGFSFNVLSKYSDVEYMKDYLHYADPAFLLDYCKRNFSKYVAVLHDYPLHEFTVLVRKDI